MNFKQKYLKSCTGDISQDSVSITDMLSRDISATELQQVLNRNHGSTDSDNSDDIDHTIDEVKNNDCADYATPWEHDKIKSHCSKFTTEEQENI